ASFQRLADFADYLVLNVSSPNTPNLRQLQDESRLRELLAAVTSANRARAKQLEAGRAQPPGGPPARSNGPGSPGDQARPMTAASVAIAASKRPVPILLKIAPDLTWPQIDAVLGVI